MVIFYKVFHKQTTPQAILQLYTGLQIWREILGTQSIQFSQYSVQTSTQRDSDLILGFSSTLWNMTYLLSCSQATSLQLRRAGLYNATSCHPFDLADLMSCCSRNKVTPWSPGRLIHYSFFPPKNHSARKLTPSVAQISFLHEAFLQTIFLTVSVSFITCVSCAPAAVEWCSPCPSGWMIFSKADIVTNRSELYFSVPWNGRAVGRWRLSTSLLLPTIFCKCIYVALMGKSKIASHGCIPSVLSFRDIFRECWHKLSCFLPPPGCVHRKCFEKQKCWEEI